MNRVITLYSNLRNKMVKDSEDSNPKKANVPCVFTTKLELCSRATWEDFNSVVNSVVIRSLCKTPGQKRWLMNVLNELSLPFNF